MPSSNVRQTHFKWVNSLVVILGAGSCAIDVWTENVLALKIKKVKVNWNFSGFLFSAKTQKSISHDPARSQVRIEERRRFLPTIR